jgi:hypothetical protein
MVITPFVGKEWICCQQEQRISLKAAKHEKEGSTGHEIKG